MKAFARQSLLAVVWVAGPLLLTACPSQAEGERCDFQNGATDCASGLSCGTANVCCVPGTAACIAPPSTSTSDGATNTPSSDAATEDEAATHDAATPDAATSEAAINEAAPNEAATMTSDTGVDAPNVLDAADGAAE